MSKAKRLKLNEPRQVEVIIQDEEEKKMKSEIQGSYEVREKYYDKDIRKNMMILMNYNKNKLVVAEVVDAEHIIIDELRCKIINHSAIEERPLKKGKYSDSPKEELKKFAQQEVKEIDDVLEKSKAYYLKELKTKIVPEPSAGTRLAVELLLIFPDGKLINRRFYGEQTGEDIINFCEVEMEVIGDIDLRLLDSKTEFIDTKELVATFSKRGKTILVKHSSANKFKTIRRA